MSADIVKYAFVAGEISPTLLGRTDLTKYDLAVAEGLNFFVDFRGGLSSRPGTELVGEVHLGDKKTRMFKFQFAPDTANSYVVLFGHNYIRFYQDGGEVISGGSPYEVATPFSEDDLDGLVVEQYRDLLRITSLDFPVYNLVRHDHTNWELAPEDISPYVPGVAITGTSKSKSGSASVIFALTKVLADGTESAIGPPTKISSMVNYSATEGAASISWAQDPDAVFYNIYRSVIVTTEDLSSGSPLGYIGRSYGTKFTDPNIVPDFTHIPPTHNNPFAPGAIEKIVVTGNGSGFTDFAAGVSIAGGGSGFVGQVVVADDGSIGNVIIKYGGQGFVTPIVSFTGGAGATAVATARPLTGTYPALSIVFQQRQIYAASANQPITIWGSRIKQFSNFAASDFVNDDDSFEFDLDSNAVVPIRHLLVTRGGLLAMTQNDVWLLNGGGVNAPLTPTNALADPQSYTGVSAVKPIVIENDLLFTEGKGHTVRMLTYNDIYKSYNSEDKSILASHLFGVGKDIVHWAYQESPYKIVWAVREDGALLAFTSIKTEDVFAWTPCQSKGKFTDVIVLQEGTEDRVYVTIERKINGSWIKFIERFDLRQYVNIEDAWCVDCGLSLPVTNPNGELTILHDPETDIWTAQISSPLAASAGDFIRGANGIFKITSGSGSNFVLEMFAEPTNWIPENNETETFPIPQGEWTCDTPVSTLSGLDHLEGEEVAILGDGNVFAPRTVIGGEITLENPVSRAIVGLPFTCRARTLPMIVSGADVEARRKRIVGIGVRLDKSRGIKIGPTLDRMSPMRERSTENYGHPTRLVNGIKYQLTYTQFDEEGQSYFVQEEPLPVNILSLVSDIEVGDEPD
jgi:hypothetical protein